MFLDTVILTLKTVPILDYQYRLTLLQVLPWIQVFQLPIATKQTTVVQ